MNALIIIYAFIILAQSLTLRTHLPLIPNPEKPQNTITDTKSTLLNNPKYILFMDELNKITNEAGFIQRTLEIQFAKKYLDLTAEMKKYHTGLEAIRKVLAKYNLFIYQKQKVCPKPQSYNKSEIYRYINFTEQKEAVVIGNISKTPDLQPLTNNTQKMKKLSDNYLKHVKLTIQGSFCHIAQANETNNGSAKKKVQKKYYKNNLDVSNWYYGSTNQVKYKAYLIKKAANFNLTTCPSQLPFVRDDQQKCFNCPVNTIYNLGAQKCDSCRPGEMLNVAKGTCEPCFGQMFIINHQFVCKACAIQAQQLFDPKTGKCYKCKLTEYLDASSRSCKAIKCPPEQPRFNKELELCQSCAYDQKINPLDPSKCVPKCSADKPLYDNKTGTCKECLIDEFYNAQLKTCKKKGVSNQNQQNNESQVQNQNRETSRKLQITTNGNESGNTQNSSSAATPTNGTNHVSRKGEAKQ